MRRWIGRAALGAICVLAVACLDRLTIPPDESLDVDGYRALGMPSLGRDWTETERETALTLLAGIAADRPAALPRLASPRSGALFMFVLDQVFDATGPIAPATLEKIRADERHPVRRLFATYGPASGWSFDREWVALEGRFAAGILDGARGGALSAEAETAVLARIDSLAESALWPDPDTLSPAARETAGSLARALARRAERMTSEAGRQRLARARALLGDGEAR